jgi:arabinose-5-phosphate isomerase
MQAFFCLIHNRVPLNPNVMKENKLHAEKLRELALAVIQVEAEAIEGLKSQIDDSFIKACNLMYRCKGRVVVIGMGKSGHIAGKIASTLASTGTPAFFVHPGEASHGDLGMITRQDVVLALSNSGETEEIVILLPIIKRLDVPLIAMTGNPKSSLAAFATAHINVGVIQEACPLG